MTNQPLPRTTGELRQKLALLVQQIETDQISTKKARSMILAIRSQLDTLRLEITAAELGKAFQDIVLDETERNATRLKAVG